MAYEPADALAALEFPRVLSGASATEWSAPEPQLGWEPAALLRLAGPETQVHTTDCSTGKAGPSMALRAFIAYLQQREQAVEKTAQPVESHVALKATSTGLGTSGSAQSATPSTIRAGGAGLKVSAPETKGHSTPRNPQALFASGIPVREGHSEACLPAGHPWLQASLTSRLAQAAHTSPSAAAALHLLCGPPGPAEPAQLAPTGALQWLVVHSGRLVARLAPGSDTNVAFFSCSVRSGRLPGMSLLKGGEELVCGAGDTLLVPPGWFLSKQILESAVATAGLCWCASHLQTHMKCMDLQLRSQRGDVTQATLHHTATLASALAQLVLDANQILRVAAHLPAFTPHSIPDTASPKKQKSKALKPAAGTKQPGVRKQGQPRVNAERADPGERAARKRSTRKKAAALDGFISASESGGGSSEDGDCERSASKRGPQTSSDASVGGWDSEDAPSFEIIGDSGAPVKHKRAAQQPSKVQPGASPAPRIQAMGMARLESARPKRHRVERKHKCASTDEDGESDGGASSLDGIDRGAIIEGKRQRTNRFVLGAAGTGPRDAEPGRGRQPRGVGDTKAQPSRRGRPGRAVPSATQERPSAAARGVGGRPPAARKLQMESSDDDFVADFGASAATQRGPAALAAGAFVDSGTPRASRAKPAGARSGRQARRRPSAPANESDDLDDLDDWVSEGSSRDEDADAWAAGEAFEASAAAGRRSRRTAGTRLKQVLQAELSEEGGSGSSSDAQHVHANSAGPADATAQAPRSQHRIKIRRRTDAGAAAAHPHVQPTGAAQDSTRPATAAQAADEPTATAPPPQRARIRLRKPAPAGTPAAANTVDPLAASSRVPPATDSAATSPPAYAAGTPAAVPPAPNTSAPPDVAASSTGLTRSQDDGAAVPAAEAPGPVPGCQLPYTGERSAAAGHLECDGNSSPEPCQPRAGEAQEHGAQLPARDTPHTATEGLGPAEDPTTDAVRSPASEACGQGPCSTALQRHTTHGATAALSCASALAAVAEMDTHRVVAPLAETAVDRPDLQTCELPLAGSSRARGQVQVGSGLCIAPQACEPDAECGALDSKPEAAGQGPETDTHVAGGAVLMSGAGCARGGEHGEAAAQAHVATGDLARVGAAGGKRTEQHEVTTQRTHLACGLGSRGTGGSGSEGRQDGERMDAGEMCGRSPLATADRTADVSVHGCSTDVRQEAEPDKMDVDLKEDTKAALDTAVQIAHVSEAPSVEHWRHDQGCGLKQEGKPGLEDEAGKQRLAGGDCSCVGAAQVAPDEQARQEGTSVKDDAPGEPVHRSPEHSSGSTDAAKRKHDALEEEEGKACSGRGTAGEDEPGLRDRERRAKQPRGNLKSPRVDHPHPLSPAERHRLPVVAQMLKGIPDTLWRACVPAVREAIPNRFELVASLEDALKANSLPVQTSESSKLPPYFTQATPVAVPVKHQARPQHVACGAALASGATGPSTTAPQAASGAACVAAPPKKTTKKSIRQLVGKRRFK